MSSPIKLDAKLSELKMADVRLLIYGTLCNDGKVSFPTYPSRIHA